MNLYLKNIFKFLGFLITAVILCFIASSLLLRYVFNHDRLNSYLDKRDRLTKLESPKIIVVGGSSIGYSLDSKKIEDSLGYPVVNMGLQGSIGLGFMIEDIKDNIQKGDIVLLVPEESQFYKVDVDGESTLYQLLTRYPEGIKKLNARQVRRLPEFILPTVNSSISGVYASILRGIQNKKGYRDMQNGYGDFIGHKGKPSIYKPDPNFKEEFKLQEKTVTLIKNFNAFVNNQGAELFVCFAPISQSRADSVMMSSIQKELLKMKNIKMIGTKDDFVFPDSYFYDTLHHLLYDKKLAFTDKLIYFLKKSR